MEPLDAAVFVPRTERDQFEIEHDLPLASRVRRGYAATDNVGDVWVSRTNLGPDRGAQWWSATVISATRSSVMRVATWFLAALSLLLLIGSFQSFWFPPKLGAWTGAAGGVPAATIQGFIGIVMLSDSVGVLGNVLWTRFFSVTADRVSPYTPQSAAASEPRQTPVA